MNFNLQHANNLPIDQCKEYITKYFFPLSTAQHVYISYDANGKCSFEIKDDMVIKKVYFNRLPKVISDFYFKEYQGLKTLTCVLNKPMLYDDCINTCPEFLHKIKPYETFSPEIKKGVTVMLDYLKSVWASGNEEQFQFILKWVANMARGGKNQSVLYLRSDEGVGKSTFTDFLMKHVIGPNLSLMSGSQPLISNFNIILYCKLLVVYEELENFSVAQWSAVSSRIKRDVTSTTCNYEKKNETSFIGNNINNIIINSNVDAIKNDEGRRYFILDLSNDKKGDVKFWDNVYANMNNDIGDGFFSYLNTIDLTTYKDQVFPKTKSKEDAIVKRLESVARFIKECYVLHSRELNCSLQYLYDEYATFCLNNSLKKECKIEMNTRLSKYKIVGFKSGKDRNKFNISKDDLARRAKDNKWLHDTDDYLFETDVFDDPVDNGIQKDDGSEELATLKKINDALKLKFNELEKKYAEAMKAMEQKEAAVKPDGEQSEEEEEPEIMPKITRKKNKPSPFEIDLDGELDDLMERIK
jgi:hypothetical protein